MFYIPRTCTRLTDQQESKPLSDYRIEPAYVLLGDPGSGKTTAFQAEWKALGDEAHYITARDFTTFDPDNHPEWDGKTLFIDGLDEVRAGSLDARTPFEVIRRHLDALGKPSFRLSCRSADWLGTNDQSNLAAVSPDGKVKVLNLDPLTESDVSDLLDAHPEVDDSLSFIREARERGIDGLLTNPLSLGLLVNLVTSNEGWPEGRRETFQRACAKMADEHNCEHQHFGSAATVEERLDAAGHLCAIHLIADVPGYASRQRKGDEEFPDAERGGYEDRDLLSAALATKLFTVDTTGVARPIHRHIAEFIGALHLARLIKDGLPAKRVIALMTGMDDLVVTELRGLSAWLAALSKCSRDILIDLDPLGVGLYGDIRDFSPDERLSLLDSLSNQVSQINPYYAAPLFADLAVPETSGPIRTILTETDRSNQHQAFVAFLLLVLASSTPLAELSPILSGMVRDETWRPDVRQSALAAFVNCCQNRCDRATELREFLASIQDGTIEDPNNELLGILLSNLYPQDLPPSEIWDHLHDTGDPNFISSYGVFWRTRLVDKSSGEQAAELLDSLKERMKELRSAFDRHRLHELPLELLERVLQAYGDNFDVRVLYDWLSEESNPRTLRGRVLRSNGVHQRIRNWLEQHPDTQKSVILEGTSRLHESGRFEFEVAAVYRCLHGAELPTDYGLWCLNQAVAIVDTRPIAAEHFLVRAFRAIRDQKHSEGLTADLLQGQVADNDRLKSKLEALTSSDTSVSYEEDDPEYREFLETTRREKAEWLAYVRAQNEALCEGRAPIELLRELSYSYLGINSTAGVQSGVQAIEQLLEGDRELVEAALEGLRLTIDAEDIPDVDEVLTARQDNQMFYISDPLMAGMAEIERAEPEKVLQLEDAQLLKVVTFCLNASDGGERPSWYRRILKARPRIVACGKVKLANSDIKSRRKYVSGLWELVNDPDHAEVARLVSLPLLRVFPTRCLTAQTEALDILLWAAILHADRTRFEELVSGRILSKRMNVAQRSRWLAAGLITSPEKYLSKAEAYARNSKYRIRHLTALFQTRPPIPIDFPVANLLIRLLGGHSSPDDLYARGYVTPAEKDARLVRDFISHLANSTDNVASVTLDELVDDPTLKNWTEVLSRSRESQRVISRDASYQHPTMEQARRTLEGSSPANTADLAALLMFQFENLARRIRTANTDDWRQYWNEDQYGKPQKPKHEDHCRDALLSDLRFLLPKDVDGQPEGQYANDKRSDIRVAYRSDFHVPVEIKKNTHPDLWSAMHDQLIELYASDPETDGFGVYLVFWFGPDYTQNSPDGCRQDGPDDLYEQLKATLSPQEARKITVCVIDVSPSG